MNARRADGHVFSAEEAKDAREKLDKLQAKASEKRAAFEAESARVQRLRVAKCVEHLREYISAYTTGGDAGRDAFLAKARADLEQLRALNMGEPLLNTIGYIYVHETNKARRAAARSPGRALHCRAPPLPPTASPNRLPQPAPPNGSPPTGSPQRALPLSQIPCCALLRTFARAREVAARARTSAVTPPSHHRHTSVTPPSHHRHTSVTPPSRHTTVHATVRARTQPGTQVLGKHGVGIHRVWGALESAREFGHNLGEGLSAVTKARAAPHLSLIHI